MPILLGAVFAFCSSIPRPAESPARPWHKVQATRFSIKLQPTRLEGGGSNQERYRKFKCQLPMNESIFRNRRPGGTKLRSEPGTDEPHGWHVRARGRKHGLKRPTIRAIKALYQLS